MTRKEIYNDLMKDVAVLVQQKLDESASFETLMDELEPIIKAMGSENVSISGEFDKEDEDGWFSMELETAYVDNDGCLIVGYNKVITNHEYHSSDTSYEENEISELDDDVIERVIEQLNDWVYENGGGESVGELPEIIEFDAAKIIGSKLADMNILGDSSVKTMSRTKEWISKHPNIGVVDGETMKVPFKFISTDESLLQDCVMCGTSFHDVFLALNIIIDATVRNCATGEVDVQLHLEKEAEKILKSFVNRAQDSSIDACDARACDILRYLETSKSFEVFVDSFASLYAVE